MNMKYLTAIPLLIIALTCPGRCCAEVKGCDAIQKLLADNFQANPGVKLDATIDEVKQLTPDVHVIRGIATVTPKDGAALVTRYVAVEVKKGDRYQVSQLTETETSPPSAYSQLRALEWLVGTWEDKAGIKPSKQRSIGQATRIF